MYLKDPKDDKPSVSLTMTMATGITALGFCINVALSGDLDPLMNLFYATAALYFGRRITTKTPNKEIVSE
jgi:hypothetical protein